MTHLKCNIHILSLLLIIMAMAITVGLIIHAAVFFFSLPSYINIHVQGQTSMHTLYHLYLPSFKEHYLLI